MRISILFMIGLLSSLSTFSQYCATSGRCGDNIQTVQFSNVTKSSGCGSGGYQYHSSDTVFVDPAMAYTITINNAVYLDARARGWIDFNGNSLFDLEEQIDFATGTVAGTHVASVTVPPSFTAGTVTRARFVLYLSGEETIDGCGNYVLIQPYEYEDYPLKAGAPSGGTYCSARGSAGATSPNCNTASTVDVHVNRVQLMNEFDNNSGTCGITSTGYSDYSAISAVLKEGDPYDLRVNIFSEGSAYESVRAWVDWNGDKVFDDVEEMLTFTNAPGDNNWTFTGNFNGEGYYGPVKLRIRGYWGYVDYIPSACGNSSRGEVEDYTLILASADAPECATNPSPTDAATDQCENGLELSWSHADVAGLEGFYLSLGTTAAADEIYSQLDVGTATSYTYNFPLTTGTTYYWKVEPYTATETAPACDVWSFTTAANPDPKPQFTVGTTVNNDTSACIGQPLSISVDMIDGAGPSFQGNWDQSIPGSLDVITQDSAVFEGDAAGDYWVYYTIFDLNNCSSTDSLHVLVHETPDAGVLNYEVDTFCGEGEMDFVVNGAQGNLQWQDSIPGGLWNDVTDSTSNTFLLNLVAGDVTAERYLRVKVEENTCVNYSPFGGMVVHPNPDQPGILAIDGYSFCEGDSARFEAQMPTDSLVWLPSGENGNLDLITVYSGQTITLRNVDVNTLCFSDSLVTVVLDEMPDAPILSETLDQVVCSANLPFSISVTNPLSGLEWMNAETTSSISLNSTTSEIWAKHVSPKGCTSYSDSIALEVISAPDKPLIDVFPNQSHVCDGDSVLLRVSNYQDNLVWSDNVEGYERYIKTGGTYSVTFGDDPSCSSTSDELFFDVLPSPDPIVLSNTGNLEGCEGDTVLLIATNYDEVVWNNILNTINDTLVVTSSGNYRATVEGDNGCSVSATREVVINDIPEPPVVEIISEGDCPGDLKILVTSQVVQWDDMGNTETDSLEVNSAGVYTATLTNGVCSSSTTTEITYEETPIAPEITQVADTLFASPDDQVLYIWYLDGEEIAQTQEPFLVVTEPGSYHVTYRNSSGCISAESEAHTVIGVSQMVKAQSIDLYPNPSSGVFRISEAPDHIVAFNAQGQTIPVEIQGEEYSIKGTGVHLIRMQYDKEIVYRKLILE